MSFIATNTAVFTADAPTAHWRRWAPSVSVGLGVYILLMCVASRLLNDPDSQWHVAVGRWIWANGRAPTTDPFSHTFLGAPWIAKEWGSQLILFAAYRAAGWSGVVAVSAAAIATAFALFHAALRRLRPSVGLALTLLALLLCTSHLLARPHALVLPVMVLWVVQLVAAREREQAPSPWLALLMVLWTNMHGSFPLGLMLAGLLAGEGVLFGTQGMRATRLRDWALFLVAAAAATLVTPYGWHALLVPLQMAGKGEDLSFIGEWRPLAFDMEGVLAISLCGVALWVLSAAARANVFRIVATLLLAVMMVRHSRFVDQFALLVPVLFAASLACRVGREAEPEDKAPEDKASWVPSLVAVGLALVALVVTACAAPLPDPQMTPESALDAALAHHVEGPVYNAYDFGGFLIAHGVPTFIDGRTDQLFMGKFLHDLDQARSDKGDKLFESLLDRHEVGWALVRVHSDDSRHLANLPGWSPVFEDGVASVFKRDR